MGDSIRFDEYESYDALGLAELVAKGEIQASELLDAAVDRMKARNPKYNAVVIPLVEYARETLAASLPEGPFRGVPFLLKDLVALCEGTRTTNGCGLYENHLADHDSEIVARYKRAGLVIFGKSASPEFGITTTTESRLFGQTRNPWEPGHVAGGSSGGAAAAVAAGILPAAHASDGGGSIRIPASCCGLFGLKPTRARNPAGPDAGEGWSGMSTAHAVTRTVRDSAALLDVIEGPELGAPYWAPPPERPYSREVGASPGRLRIALVTQTFNGSDTHPDCEAAARNAGKLCASLGHEVEETRLELDAEAIAKATGTIIGANLTFTLEDRARALGRELRQGDVETVTWLMTRNAKQNDAAEYARSIRVIHSTGREVERFLGDYDVILTPTMAAPPCQLGELALMSPDPSQFLPKLLRTVGFTQLFNASGHPAMSLPLYWNAQGLPIGVQFAGRFGDEATLFQLAGQLEEARPWFDQRAAL